MYLKTMFHIFPAACLSENLGGAWFIIFCLEAIERSLQSVWFIIFCLEAMERSLQSVMWWNSTRHSYHKKCDFLGWRRRWRMYTWKSIWILNRHTWCTCSHVRYHYSMKCLYEDNWWKKKNHLKHEMPWWYVIEHHFQVRSMFCGNLMNLHCQSIHRWNSRSLIISNRMQKNLR